MIMEKLQDYETVITIIASILSILSFFGANRERKKCQKIQTNIEVYKQNNSTINSSDTFDITNVEKFDNSKNMSS